MTLTALSSNSNQSEVRILPEPGDLKIEILPSSEAPWMHQFGSFVHAGAWEWDIEADVFAATPEVYTLFGFELPLRPTTYWDWVGAVLPEDRERFLGQFSRLAENMQSIDASFRVGSDGNTRWIHVRGEIVGEPRQAKGIVVDATRQQKMMAETFNEISRRQEDIAYELSDELAQQLTGIMMRCEMLLENMHQENGQNNRAALSILLESLRTAQSFTRELSASITPIIVPSGDFYRRLEQLADRVSVHEGVRCSVQRSGAIGALCDYMATQMYRMAESCIAVMVETKVVRRLFVTVTQPEDRLKLEVRAPTAVDAATLEATSAYQDLKLRAAVLDADLEVESEPAALIRCSM